MSAETLYTPPSEIRAGDSAEWRRTFPEYAPADGWVLAYTLIGRTAVHTITASTEGNGFKVTLTAADTVAWPAGAGTLVEYVTNGPARKTLAEWPLTLLPDLAAASAGVDLRSPAQKMLDTIEVWMSTKSPVHGSVQYGDRRVDQYSPADLLAIRSRLRAEVAAEGSGKGLVRRVAVSL